VLIQASGRSNLALLDVRTVLEKPWTAAHLREVIHGAVESHRMTLVASSAQVRARCRPTMDGNLLGFAGWVGAAW
jgi:hypothetical protein